MGALCARRRFAAITGSKLRIKSYLLLASSLHVCATEVVIILFIMLVDTKDSSRPAGLLKQLLIGTVFRTICIGRFFRSVSYFSGLFCIGLFCMGLFCTGIIIHGTPVRDVTVKIDLFHSINAPLMW